jgi:hypothetical protein
MELHMCSKEGPISALEVTTKNIEKCLSEQGETMKEFVDILKQISAQNQQIISLQATDIRHDQNFKELFPRVGALEVKAARENVRIGFIMAGMATASSALTVALGKYWTR